MLCFFDLASPPSRMAYAAGIVVCSLDLRGEVAPVAEGFFLENAAEGRKLSPLRSVALVVVGGGERREGRERRLVVKKISTVTAGR
jgi:hypothetical protein